MNAENRNKDKNETMIEYYKEIVEAFKKCEKRLFFYAQTKFNTVSRQVEEEVDIDYMRLGDDFDEEEERKRQRQKNTG